MVGGMLFVICMRVRKLEGGETPNRVELWTTDEWLLRMWMRVYQGDRRGGGGRERNCKKVKESREFHRMKRKKIELY